MTRPSGARWSSVGKISASKARFVTSNTSWSRLEAVSSGPNSRNVAGLRLITSRSQRPSGRVPWVAQAPGLMHLGRVAAEVRQIEIAQQQPAVGVRVRAHPPVAARGQRGQFLVQDPVVVEQLLRAVAPHPLLQQAKVLGVAAGIGNGHLVGAAGAFHLDDRPRPWGRSSPWGWDDHRPPGPGQVAVLARASLDGGDLLDHRIQRGGQLLVDLFRVIPGHPVHGQRTVNPIVVVHQPRRSSAVGVGLPDANLPCLGSARCSSGSDLVLLDLASARFANRPA